jgi:hypothetical protein
VNWGEVTTPRRWLGLLSHRDFTGLDTGVSPPTRLGTTLGSVLRDFGLVGMVLAALGAWFARTLDHGRQAFLIVAGTLNLLAVGFGATQIGRMSGFATIVMVGGWVLDLMLVAAILVALGVTFVVTTIGARVTPPTSRWAVPAVAGVLGILAVVPSVLVHREYADHRVPAFADRYGAEVLRTLPPDSALLVFGEEYAMPMVYRQVLAHERPDVAVIAVNSVGIDWAADQLSRRYDLGTALEANTVEQRVLNLVHVLQDRRPVFLDVMAMAALRDLIGYRTDGFVGEVVDGTGPQSTGQARAIATGLQRYDDDLDLGRADYNRLPYRAAVYFSTRAHIELAKAYAAGGDVGAAIAEIETATRLFPDDHATLATLERLPALGDTDARAAIADL